jgi:N-acetyl-1-D-myo-inositol-2-amino-2-deoxy-alpha-D-glucopyranoside deacetylase
MRALGVTDWRFLGGAGRYRDSGMIGTPANQRPRAFWHADLAEAVAQAVAVVREVRPHVVVTYDEVGGYGHPDHVQAHRVAMAAVDAAADPAQHPDLGPAWTVPKVYWNAMPRSVVQRGIEALTALGEDAPFMPMGELDDVPFAVDDDVVTTEVDGRRYAAAKEAALRAHRTQLTVDGPFFALTNGLGQPVLVTEHYRLVRGTRGPAGSGAHGWEDDLFAGLDDERTAG